MINNITQHFTRNSAITSSKHRIASINSILIAFFKKFFILISKPVYTITPNGIKISILYFLPNKPRRKSLVGKKQIARRPVSLKARKLAYWNQFITKITPGTRIAKKETRFQRSRITFLVLLLSKLLQTNVQLELVRLKYVYHDSNILAQFLGINSHKNTYARFKNLLWQRVTTLSVKDNSLLNTTQDSPVTQLTGFKIKISGRLAKQRVIPKKTVKSTYKGAISPNKNNLVQEATFTGKNKKGAYSIRVWTSHGTTPKA
jgi:ribosomal VAR1-like protein